MLATPNTLNFKMPWKAKLQSPRKRDLSSTLLPSLKNPSRLHLKRKTRCPRDPFRGDPSGLHTRLKMSVPLRGCLEEVRRSGVKKKVGEGRKLSHCNFLFRSYHQLVCFRKTKRSCDRGPKSAFTLLTCSHIGFNLGKWQNYCLALGRELDVTPSKTISMSMLWLKLSLQENGLMKIDFMINEVMKCPCWKVLTHPERNI